MAVKHLSWDEGWRIIEDEYNEVPLDTAVRQHVDHCASCSLLLAQVRQTLSTLRDGMALPSDVLERANDDALWRGLQERIVHDNRGTNRDGVARQTSYHRGRPFSRVAGWMGAAAVLVVVVGGVETYRTISIHRDQPRTFNGMVTLSQQQGNVESSSNQVQSPTQKRASGSTDVSGGASGSATHSVHSATTAGLFAAAPTASTTASAMNHVAAPTQSSPMVIRVTTSQSPTSPERPILGANVEVMDGNEVLWRGVTDYRGLATVTHWETMMVAHPVVNIVVRKQGFHVAKLKRNRTANGQSQSDKTIQIALSSLP